MQPDDEVHLKDTGPLTVPTTVRYLLGGLLIVQWYAYGMSIPLLAIGMFAGPIPLLAGLVHFLMGLASQATRAGLTRGRPAALWATRFLSVVLTLPLPVFLLAWGKNPDLDATHAIFPAIFTSVGVALLLATLLRDVRDWTRA